MLLYYYLKPGPDRNYTKQGIAKLHTGPHYAFILNIYTILNQPPPPTQSILSIVWHKLHTSCNLWHSLNWMSFFQNFQKKHGLYTKLTPLINTRPNAWYVMLYCKGSVRLGRLKFCLSSVGSGRVESCGLNKTQNNLKSTRPDPTRLKHPN